MRNYLVYCGYPAVDSLIKEIVVFNYFKKDTKPEHIKLFDDEGVYESSSEQGHEEEWGEVRLYGVKYYCPKCDSFGVCSIKCVAPRARLARLLSVIAILCVSFRQDFIFMRGHCSLKVTELQSSLLRWLEAYPDLCL